MSKESQKLRFIKLSENAYAPQRATSFAAGFDLRSANDCVVLKKDKTLIKTDIAIELPSNCYGRIASRSGLALKHSIVVGAGVVDPDYRGNIAVLLFNLSDSDFQIKKGDKIAQLICESILFPEIIELKSLSSTERGVRGFGSTGIV